MSFLEKPPFNRPAFAVASCGSTEWKPSEPFNAAAKQPTPKGSGTPIIDLVIADLETRAKAGEKKYGEQLKAHNGRDSLLDAYQEALDLCMYLRQAIEERK